MSYIGKTPTSVPLTSSDITDGIITTTKIADANVTNPKLISGSQQNFRNIIINGDMSIAQRATSQASITSSGYFTIDRYRTGYVGLGTWTQSQSTDVPSGQGFAKSLKMDCTTADGSPASGDQLNIQTKFEGQNLQYLKKGTSSAESTTMSFWVKSNKTGTYICELLSESSGSYRQISKSYTISSANTWEKKTLTFAGDTSGAFDNDNSFGVEVNFWLGAGSTYSSGTLSTSWSSVTNANRAVGQVNLADSTSNEWYITGVQLEAGTTASDFEFLPVDVNLQRCERYFKIVLRSTGGDTTICNGAMYDGSQFFGTFEIGKGMRAIPTMSATSGTNFYGVVGNSATYSFNSLTFGGISNAGTSKCRIYVNSVSGKSQGHAVWIRFKDASSTADFISASSEL